MPPFFSKFSGGFFLKVVPFPIVIAVGFPGALKARLQPCYPFNAINI